MGGNDLFSRVQSAYEQAQTLHDEELADFLTELAENDPQVADEVWGMLEVDGRGSSEPGPQHRAAQRHLDETAPAPKPAPRDGLKFEEPHRPVNRPVNRSVNRPASPPANSPAPKGPERKPNGLPSRIAGFNIIDTIGTGDTGTVLLAEQDRPRRQVALKIVRPGLVSPRALKRLEFDADVLARLTHRGVASVYAVGEDAGKPYFAMELVKGPPLFDYAAQNRMKPRVKTGLIVDVCDAVHHAHAKGVLHLHIKPANLRVDFEGFPKILDFGVARAMEPDAESAQKNALIVGDLAYMSPEQVAGDPRDVDGRSDVYAIGAILYELLTGVRPIDTEGVPIVEACERVTTQAPTPPSKHNPRLDRDYDAVLLKALAKDPEERYQSAWGLGQDLKRVMAKRPVNARRHSLRYLARKTAQRSLPAAVLGSALIAAVLGGAGYTAYGFFTESVAASHYETEASRATHVNRFLIDELLGGVSAGDAEVRAAELLDRAAGRVGRATGVDPAAEAQIRSVMARTYFNLGRYKESAQQWRLALNGFDRATDSSPEEVIDAMASLGEALRGEGDLNGAEAALNNATQRAEAAGIGESPATLSLVNSLAEIRVARGELADGIAMHEQNMAKRRALLGKNHPDVLESMMNLAKAELLAGETEKAEGLLLLCGLGRKEAMGPEHPRTIETLTLHAQTLRRLGRLEDARKGFKEVVDADTRVLGPDHPDTLACRVELASIMLELGDSEPAAEQFARIVEIQKRTLGEHDPRLAVSLYGWADALIALGRFEDAVTPAERAADIRRASLDVTSADRVDAEILLSRVYKALGRDVEADTTLVRAIAAAEPVAPKGDAVKNLRLALETQRQGE